MNLRFAIIPKLSRDFRAATARRDSIELNRERDWSQWQLAAVRQRWADAITDVPYYTALVAGGLAPREICSWEDFLTIPVLTRQIIQDSPSGFLRQSRPPLDYVTTAGSTGTPLRFGIDQSTRDLMRIVKLSAWLDLGYSPESRLFLIWGHAHLLGTGCRGRLNHIRRKLADLLFGYKRVDAYCLNQDACIKYANELITYRPTGLVGYASALDLFARHTVPFRDRFRTLGLKFVLATAEPMPHPDTQSRLQDLFGCRVVEEYGGAEFGQIAFKSGCAPFEVYSDLNYLEGETTESDQSTARPLLLTALYPRYTPLFRYRLGDAVQGVDCLPYGHMVRFKTIAGRSNDVIQFEDGYSVHSVAIFHCIHQESSVHNIQMILTDHGVEIHLISTTPGESAVERRILNRLRQVYPPLSLAKIVYAEDLMTNRAGKRRWFVDQRSKPPPSN